MKWKYLLFDLDGTLTDSSEGIINCVQYALKDAGRELNDRKELLRFIGPPLIDGFQEITGMTPEEAARAVVKYRERYGVIGLFENKTYEGIGQVLAELKKEGAVISLATSKPEDYSLRILQHFHLMPYFDEVVGSLHNGERNNKKDVIAEVFRRLDLSEEEKKETLMIGDRKHDIIGAKAMGIASMGVYYGFAQPGELEEAGADYIVHTVDEIPDCIRKNQESDGK